MRFRCLKRNKKSNEKQKRRGKKPKRGGLTSDGEFLARGTRGSVSGLGGFELGELGGEERGEAELEGGAGEEEEGVEALEEGRRLEG